MQGARQEYGRGGAEAGEPKDTRATMRAKIDDFSQSSSENEQKVRDLLTKIKSTQKYRSKENEETDEEAESGTDQTQQPNFRGGTLGGPDEWRFIRSFVHLYGRLDGQKFPPLFYRTSDPLPKRYRDLPPKKLQKTSLISKIHHRSRTLCSK